MKKSNVRTVPLIGMSPGNGYFKVDIVEKIIENLFSRYDNIAVFIPDIPATSTYVALGYSLSRAMTKAKKAGNNLKSRVRRSLVKYPGSVKKSVHIMDWKNDVQENVLYLESHEKILELFMSNPVFHFEVVESSRLVLEASGKILNHCTEEQLLKASEYVLAELAFLEIYPRLLGADIVNLIYHRDWPVYENYISGKYDGIQKKHLAFEKLIFSD